MPWGSGPRRPVVRGAAEALGLTAVQIYTGETLEEALDASHWVLASTNREFLDSPEVKESVTAWADDDPPILWTDRKSSLLQALR